MKRTLSTLITVAILIAAGSMSYAAAASLSVTSTALGTGRTTISACDSNGFAYTHTLSTSHNVTSVTVSGIDVSCAGQTLQLTLADNTNASTGAASAALPASGFLGWVTLTLTGTPPSANVAAYRVAISG